MTKQWTTNEATRPTYKEEKGEKVTDIDGS